MAQSLQRIRNRAAQVGRVYGGIRNTLWGDLQDEHKEALISEVDDLRVRMSEHLTGTASPEVLERMKTVIPDPQKMFDSDPDEVWAETAGRLESNQNIDNRSADVEWNPRGEFDIEPPEFEDVGQKSMDQLRREVNAARQSAVRGEGVQPGDDQYRSLALETALAASRDPSQRSEAIDLLNQLGEEAYVQDPAPGRGDTGRVNLLERVIQGEPIPGFEGIDYSRRQEKSESLLDAAGLMTPFVSPAAPVRPDE